MPTSTTATVIRAQLQAILLSCQQRVMDCTLFPEERVRIFDPDLAVMPPPQADQVIHVWLEAGTPTDNYLGSGRIDHRVKTRIVVQVATRYAVDEDDSLEQWLIGQQLGHLSILGAVDNALIEWFPEDAQGNALTTHPIEPSTTPKPQPDKKEPGWGYTRLSYLATRIVPLDQRYDGTGSNPPGQVI